MKDAANAQEQSLSASFACMRILKLLIISFAFVFILNLSSLMALTLTVGYGEGYDYNENSIGQAIQYLIDSTEVADSHVRLLIGPGTYSTIVPYQINMANTIVQSLTIESISGAADCILIADPPTEPGELGRLFRIQGNPGKDVVFKNLTMSYDGGDNSTIYCGIGIAMALPRKIQVEGCVFTYKHRAIDLRGSMQGMETEVVLKNNQFLCTANGDSLEYSIAAINVLSSALGSSVNLTMEGNTFNNIGSPMSVETRSLTAFIRNNQFINEYCSVQIGGSNMNIAIHDYDAGDNSSVIFENNLLYNVGLILDSVSASITANTFWIDDLLLSNGGFISNVQCWNELMDGVNPPPPVSLSFSNNLFYTTPTNIKNVELQTNQNSGSGNVLASFDNNTFFSNSHVLKIVYTGSVPQHQITRFRNNLLSCDPQPFKFATESTQVINTFVAEHCVFENGYTTEPGFSVDALSCYVGDPALILNPVSKSYQLLWTDTVKSPCINNGYRGANNVITDPDGTPPDIGCVYYPHVNRKYFERSNSSGIYWTSFPVLDDRTYDSGMYWNELRHMFGTQMDDAPDSQLNQIQWSYDTYRLSMLYDNYDNYWLNDQDLCIQPKGYKVQFNPGQTSPVIVNGFKADAGTTPAAWVREVEENGQVRPFENWIGYYVPYTQKAGDALSKNIPGSTRTTYLDFVHTIKTQTWSICRMSEEPNSPWLGDPNKFTLSEGDMVVLMLLPNAPQEMYWNSFNANIQPIVRPPASAFVFEEKLDYTPVYIELDPNNLPDEVGVFVNGVCKGASVVDSTMIDVCFYNESSKDGGDMEVMFYYSDKGKKVAKGWKVYNPETLVFEDGVVKVNGIGRYAYISFNRSEGESPVPLVTRLQPNYPNPFNPSTTISFVLSREMNAQLEVYNIRGQKVLTLHNAPLGIGRHSFVWNGKDQQGRQVSSGIYFSRLNTPEGSFTQKMMLMK